jgi:hypothetical protein
MASAARAAAVVRRSQIAFGACVAAALLATASLTTGAAWGAASGLPGTGDKSFNPAGSTGDNHRVSLEGVDANALLGISEQLVLPGACDVVQTGEFYVFFNAAWTMNSSWEAVPADYTPSAPTPVRDFVSKVRSVTFVVDPGTKHEHSYRYAAQDIMDVRTIHDFFLRPDRTYQSRSSSQSSRHLRPATTGSVSPSK